MGIARGAMIVALVLIGVAGCAASKQPPLNQAKAADKAASDTWQAVQDAFAQARFKGEKAEEAAQALPPGAISKASWDRFVDLDKKVLGSGKALTAAIRSWEAGASTSPDQINKLTAELMGFFDQAMRLAQTLGVKIPALPTKAAILEHHRRLATGDVGGLLLMAGALGVPMRRRERGASLPPISGGSAAPEATVALGVLAGMVTAGGPLIASMVKDDQQRQQVEQAIALFGAFANGMVQRLPGIVEGIERPEDIKLSDLWNRDAAQALEQYRQAQSA